MTYKKNEAFKTTNSWTVQITSIKNVIKSAFPHSSFIQVKWAKNTFDYKRKLTLSDFRFLCRLNILINRQLTSRSIKTAHLAGLACFWRTWFLLQSYVIQVTPVMWLSWFNIILKCQQNTTFDEKIFWITLSTYVQKFTQ